MKKTQGFTLVELLVVIVIIGILATGSVSMFTGAQQKARDSVRITDIQAIKTSVEQAYGDGSVYPAATSNDDTGLNVLITNGYIDRMPEDPKTLQKAGSGCLVYVYAVADDATTHVYAQEFELSAMFENAGNQSTKSAKDEGNDAGRWETGVNIDHVNTDIEVSGGGNCTTNDLDGENTFEGDSNTEPLIVDTL